MRLARSFCFLTLMIAAAAAPAQLNGVHSVYLFPMRSGLEQYIANRLTNEGVFQVVSDPKLADAVFTDQLGEAFEYQLDHIHAPSKPLPTPEKKSDDDKKTDSASATPAAQQDEPPRISSFGRGRGTLFLVSARSKQVLWSIYEKPKNSSAEQLDKTARRIVDHLRKETGKP